MNADRWKAEQRDWILWQLSTLINRWEMESKSEESQFCADPEADRIAKGRTGGCAQELGNLLSEIMWVDSFARIKEEFSPCSTLPKP